MGKVSNSYLRQLNNFPDTRDYISEYESAPWGSSVRSVPAAIDVPNSNRNAYFTPSGTITGARKTFSIFIWYRRKVSTAVWAHLFSAFVSTGDRCYVCIDPSNNLYFGNVDPADGTCNAVVITSTTFAETTGWHSILVAVDTTLSSNRIRLYKDGAECSYSTASYPSQNAAMNMFKSTHTHYIFTMDGSSYQAYGLYADLMLVDGVALTPSDILTDGHPQTPTWTWGNQGRWFDFSNNSTENALWTDHSGNGLNATQTNYATTDQSTSDVPP